MTSRVDLDYTLKQKILTLYDENHNVADAIVSKWLLPQINETNIASFVKICHGKSDGGPIGTFEIEERFRWLTAVKSSSIQTSRPHSGFSSDLDATFEKLYTELVL